MTTQEKIEAIESARRDACRAHNDTFDQNKLVVGLCSDIARRAVREFLDDCDRQITALYQRLAEERKG